MNLDFINDIKSGKRIFGNPELRLSMEIKETEDKLNKYKASLGRGDFFIPNKQLESHFKDLKNERVAVKKYGEYILKLINKVTEEPFRNMIVFCDVALDDNEYEKRFHFAVQTRYQTYLINFNEIKSQTPVYIMDGVVFNPEGKELHTLDTLEENLYEFKILNVCYTKDPLIILKNDNYYNSGALLMNISDLKQFIENDKREPLGEKRYEILSFLYEHYFKKEETEFVRNMKEVLEN